MNKQCYKIIFNKKRNQMMAVAEIATAEGKHSQNQPAGTHQGLGNRCKSVVVNILSFSVLWALGLANVQASAIHADPNAPKNQRPSILQTANGLPQVNIQTPSKHGVSMNQYQQMDIDRHGAILNNSRKNTQTQLAGMVQGNPYLAGGEARVIVNQINSNNPSQLNGHLEVAGRRAELIIANPSGININGGGFINAAGVTLATGKVNYDQGRLQGLDVNRGRITIEGNGLDTSQADYTRILTTAAEINAKLWANDLNIVAGHNQFDADGQRQTLENGDQPRQPGVAIDTALLGGMYAGKIYLIVTDKGDSVNIDGKIYSSKFHLSADGMLTTSGDIVASSDTDPTNTSLNINAQGVNNSGNISSQGTADIHSNSLNNQGLITSAGELNLNQQQLTNQGNINAGRLSIDGDSLNNSGHISQSGQQDLNINSDQLINQQSGRIGQAMVADNGHNSSDGNNNSNTNNNSSDNNASNSSAGNGNSNNDNTNNNSSNSSSNKPATDNSTTSTTASSTPVIFADGHINARNIDNSGQIEASGDISLSSTNLINQGKLNLASLSLSGDELNNQHGQINAGKIEINSREVNNQHGQISANNQLHINGQKINNQEGKLQAGGDLSLEADSIDNSNQGVISSNQNLILNSSQLNNQEGQMWAAGNTHLNVEQLNNQQGKLQAGGNVSLQSERTDNSNQGLISSNQHLTLNSNQLNNQTGQLWAGGQLTLTVDNLNNQSGAIDADSLRLTADNVNNSQGFIRTNQTLSANIGQSLNNQAGQISSAKDLSINGSNSLNIDNSHEGKILAGQNLNLNAKHLTNQGSISAGQDATIALIDDFSVDADLTAGHDLNLSSQGNITNHKNISANHNVSLQAANIDNKAEGTIQSNNQTWLSADNLTNRGLINSNGLTLIEASHNLTNIGSGRIYGDHIALQADSLTNREETLNGETKAATIAARQRLDIGAKHITNQEHALISSSGDLAIGGALDKDHHATGRADSLINGSARIEASGNGHIAVNQLQNLNNHFSVEEYLASKEHIQQYQESGNPEIWVNGKDGKFKKERKKLTFTFNDGSKKTWSKYNVSNVHWWDFDRTTYRQRVTESDPGQIIIGGNLSIEGTDWLNHNSQIIVGGDLTAGEGLNLENRETKGEQRQEDKGKQGGYKYKNPKLGKGKIKTTNEKKYQQSITTTHDFDSPVSVIQQHTATDHQGQTQAASIQNVQQNGQGAQTGQNSRPSLVSTLQPKPITLPDNSLYAIKPDNPGYLIETDSAFTNQKQWLGSDYMLSALGQDPQKMQKRLGDGYYEQQLIQNQIMQITGNRYLDGHDNDLEQYQALMNAGIEYAQKYNLTPGVALSAEQMQQLTSNIVWLENQTVTLADGSSQTVLVPKVYLVAANTQITPDGALISANNINLSNAGNIANQGSISASNNLSLGAHQIDNSGLISGNNVILNATDAINFNGGVAVAKDNLSLKADQINLTSTTINYGDDRNGGQLIDRVAGVYVTGEADTSEKGTHGLLSLEANHDLTTHGAQISNQSQSGTTQLISHQGDINLGTVSQSQNMASGNSSDKNHWINHYQGETGTSIDTHGDINLISGHDINIRQGDINSDQGRLNLAASNNINIEAGRQQTELDHSVYIKTNNITSKKTQLDQYQAQYDEAIGSSLGASQISLLSGHDINVSGSNIISDNGTQLMAGNDININATDNSYYDHSYHEEKKSGLMGSGGIGFSVGKEKDTTDNKDTTHIHTGSMVGSLGGDTTIVAGHNYTQTGSSVLAPQGNISINAEQINVNAA
ncbi:filamentous hemagglutinin N-terminal domain-containing protein, partial [Neisseriaceae bacterium ESL0693]|nr:filamentous hemagglutinin N-terminal domain-containing protein [Neisseriaceae bacterium ESL0693]